MEKMEETKTGKSNVLNLNIKYVWKNLYGEKVKTVSGEMRKDEVRIGGITSESDGRLYISFDTQNTISKEDKITILNQIISDIDEIFNNQ